MKHRSVIAFVIVAAVLFSLPQLSHDLRALKGEVGARLHRELLHAFLSLPAGEPTAPAVPAARMGQALLASCKSGRSGGEGVKGRKGGAGGSHDGRAAERTFERRAMIGDPLNDPVVQQTTAAAEEVAASVADVKVEAEVAMIIPPESGIDPRTLANALSSTEVARVEADNLRMEADGLRMVYAAAARFEANGPEWQKATGDALRKLDASRPGAYEFSVLRDGSKTKVLKFKCAECPAPAPRLTRLPRQAAVSMPLPPLPAPADAVGE